MNTLWTNCEAGTNIILDMVKSDWGKLRYVGNKLITSQEEGGWKYYDTDKADWKTMVTNSLEAYYFQSLIPAVWKIDYKWDQTDNYHQPSPKTFYYYDENGAMYPCELYCVCTEALLTG
jgi:hypothetical protein